MIFLIRFRYIKIYERGGNSKRRLTSPTSQAHSHTPSTLPMPITNTIQVLKRIVHPHQTVSASGSIELRWGETQGRS